MRWHFLALLSLFTGLCGFMSATFADDKNTPTAEEQKTIKALIKDLGDDSWHKREKASYELGKMGRKPKAQLVEALKCRDLEVIRRSERLLRPIYNEEAWDPVIKKVSFKKTKVSKILEAIGGPAGLRFNWGPYYDKSTDPGDPEIDFSGEGTVAELLRMVESKASIDIVDCWNCQSPCLYVIKAAKNRLGKATSGNLWVTYAARPFLYGDGTCHINLQIISDGNQPLAGLNLPLKARAETDTGEELKLDTAWEPYQTIRGDNDPSKKLEVSFNLAKAAKKYDKLAKLDLELTLITYSARKTMVFDKLKETSEKQMGSLTLSCDGLNTSDKRIVSTKFRQKGYSHGDPVFELVDTAGKRVTAHYAKRDYLAGDPPPWEVYFDVTKIGTPARIEVLYYTRSAYKSVRVSLKDTTVNQ